MIGFKLSSEKNFLQSNCKCHSAFAWKTTSDKTLKVNGYWYQSKCFDLIFSKRLKVFFGLWSEKFKLSDIKEQQTFYNDCKYEIHLSLE